MGLRTRSERGRELEVNGARTGSNGSGNREGVRQESGVNKTKNGSKIGRVLKGTGSEKGARNR